MTTLYHQDIFKMPDGTYKLKICPSDEGRVISRQVVAETCIYTWFHAGYRWFTGKGHGFRLLNRYHVTDSIPHKDMHMSNIGDVLEMLDLA
jgi:hypothetical protein